jgi:hypothetical protein
MKVFLPATLLFAAAATALPGKAPVPSFTPNKLPDLGEPELVPEMLIPGASGYRQPPNAPVYPFWTTPSCDMDHPHPAVEGRPWQEIQFNDVNQCVNIDKWTPRSSSGYTFRVADYSMLKNEEDAPCHIVMYQGWNCAPVRTNWGSYIMLQSRVSFKFLFQVIVGRRIFLPL